MGTCTTRIDRLAVILTPLMGRVGGDTVVVSARARVFGFTPKPILSAPFVCARARCRASDAVARLGVECRSLSRLMSAVLCTAPSG